MRRTTVVVALSGLLAASSLAAAPAEAAKPPAHTTISAHLAPATALVKSTAVVSGTVSPVGGSVVLQQLVGKTWHALAHKTPTKGAYSFSVRAPKAAATWRLRVVRAASKTAKAGVSPSLTLHVVPTGYVVAAAAAAVTAPAPVVVTGSVAPKATGSVQVQQLAGTTWNTVGTGKLSATSTFSVTTSLPAGSVRLRVVKPYTTTIAAGTSGGLDVTVQPAVAAPTVTTAALPQSRVGATYLAVLTAAGGTGPYTWSATGLPGGLTLSAAGALSGTPTSIGSSTVAVRVTDAAGRTATASLTLAVAAPAGRLFSVGDGNQGSLGNGSTTESNTVVPVSGQSAVVSVAGGPSFGVAADADGTVWGWGNNVHGQLGNGTTNNSSLPVQALGLSGVTAVATAGYTVLALRSDGTVWTWGYNLDGQLGDGTTTQRLTPAQVGGLSSIVAVAGGGDSSYALRSDGTVWAWGDNGFSQLGNGSTANSLTPVQVSGLSRVTAITAGSASGYALLSDGTVWSWGLNSSGQLGDGTTTTTRPSPVQVTSLAGVVAIAAGDIDGYALSGSGTVLAWGNGGNSSLGTGSSPPSTSTPVAVHTLTGVTEIAGAGDSALARLSDGSVWAWGLNIEGELGIGTAVNGDEPAAMLGVTHAISLGRSINTFSSYVITD